MWDYQLYQLVFYVVSLIITLKASRVLSFNGLVCSTASVLGVFIVILF